MPATGEWKGDFGDVWDLFACLFFGVLARIVRTDETKSCKRR
jgi:hypothetical protein